MHRYDLGFGTDTFCAAACVPDSVPFLTLIVLYQNITYFLNNPEQYPRKLLFLTYHQIGNTTSNCLIMKIEKYK